jgi:Ferredoxin-like domain in Api92-like protein
MPNWTSNIIRAEGDEDDILAFLDAVKSPDEIFDFNRIIPMPEILNHTGSENRTIAGKDVTSWYVINKGDPVLGDDGVRLFTRKEKALLKRIGHNDWYSWCNTNWGTKWNACHTEISEQCLNNSFVEIRFDTAWGEPQPILRRMIEMFPKLSFTCSWQYEDEQDLWHSIETQPEAAA